MPSDKLLRAKHDLAKTQTQDLNGRIRQVSASTFCRWFYLDTEHSVRDYDQFQGPWASDVQDLRGQWPVRVALQTPTQEWEAQKPSWLRPSSADEDEEPLEEKSIVRSTWSTEELDSNAQGKAEFKKAMRPKVLLAADDGTPLVFQLTSSRISGSKIMIAANGAPFLNGSLVDTLHQRVAEKIVEDCLPAEKVALIAYDNQSGLLISQAAETEQIGAGLEMLTVWPLSAITMPAALLGIIVCAVLFPILGRPRELPSRSVTDFGMHVEALGSILQGTRDTGFAKQAIADYFNRVRREKPPFWLEQIEEPKLHRPPAPIGQPVGVNPNAETPIPKDAASGSKTNAAAGSAESSSEVAASQTQAGEAVSGELGTDSKDATSSVDSVGEQVADPFKSSTFESNSEAQVEQEQEKARDKDKE